MPAKKSVKIAKVKKNEPIEDESVPPDDTVEVETKKKEPKKRASRAKKQPTKEELLKMLLDESNEIKQLIQDYKEDEMKISSLSLKKIPELLKDELQDLQDEQKEIDEKYEEVKSLPDPLVE